MGFEPSRTLGTGRSRDGRQGTNLPCQYITGAHVQQQERDTSAVDAVRFYDDLWRKTRRVDQHHKCRIVAIERMIASLPRNGRLVGHILELGSGSGIVAAVLARYGDVTGVDQSSVGVEIARRSVKGKFVVGTLPEIPVEEESFDLCVMTQVIEHLSPGAQVQVLRNAWRKVKPGGALLVTTPNRPVSTAMRFARGELQPVENWFDTVELRELLMKTGWRPGETMYAFSFFPVAASRFTWVRALRFLAYDVLHLRQPIERIFARSGYGDTIVSMAYRP
jgi:SAM-dependent methyltransferase